MVAIEVNKNLAFRKFKASTQIGIRVINTDVGLIEFVDGIVNDDIDLAAIFVVEKLGDIQGIVLGRFDDILCYVLPARIEVSNEMI